MRPDITVLMQSAELDPLLERLQSYMSEGTGKAGFLIDREVLRSIVFEAGGVYEGTWLEADMVAKSTMHELPAALVHVARLLTDEANYADVLIKLGAPVMLDLSPDTAAMQRAVERHEALLQTLETLWHDAPPPPPKRGPGHPSRSADFRCLVFFLAQTWQSLSGQRAQSWRAGKRPATPSARFIRDVVAFVAPEQLGELRNVLRDFVASRRDPIGFV